MRRLLTLARAVPAFQRWLDTSPAPAPVRRPRVTSSPETIRRLGGRFINVKKGA